MPVAIARGVVRTPGRRRVVVQFDEASFAEIRGLAKAERTSFAEQIRTLVEWGLEARPERRAPAPTAGARAA